jgi:hypothetical protein
MEKLIVLLSIMMLPLTAFSQIDTDTIPVKILPIPTVKLIIKDIIVGDSAIAELKLCEEQVSNLEKYIFEKDKIIMDLNNRNLNCEDIIKYEKEKYSAIQKYSESLEKDLKIQKTNNKWNKLGFTAIIGTLVTILIIK